MQQDQSQYNMSLINSIASLHDLKEMFDHGRIKASGIVDTTQHGRNHRNGLRQQQQQLDLGSIVSLNNEGIEFFEKSNYFDAVNCFRNALNLLEMGQSPDHYLTNTNTNARMADSATTTFLTCYNSHHQDYSSLKQQRFVRATGCEEKAQQNQKIEYDEGMNMFATPIRLDISIILQQQQGRAGMKNMFHITATTILLYNIGQGLTRFQNEQRNAEAIDCFYQALFLAKRNLSIFSSASFHSALRDDKRHSQCCDVSPVEILHNIGFLQFRNGDYEQAIETFNEALQHCLHGQQNLQQQYTASGGNLGVAVTFNCLGVLHLYSPKADTARSLDYLLKALDMRAEILGHGENRNIATNLNNIGRVFYLQGKHKDALRFYEEALRIRRNVLGNGSLDVAATICNTGQTYHRMGRLDQALLHYQEYLQIAIPKLGETHHDVATTYQCMADVYHERNEYNSSITLYEKALVAVRENYGRNHEEVASILNKMGNLFYESNNFNEAMDMYQEGLLVERKVLDRFHPNISVTLSNIGQIYKQQGECTNALEAYEEALGIQMQSLGKSNLNVASTLSNMGLIRYRNNEYMEALELFQEALSIRRNKFGQQANLEIASSLNSIGLVLFKLRLHEMAIQSFLESLEMRRSLLGPTHRDVAILIYNIATIYMELGNDEEALKYYAETLRVEREVLGHNSKDQILTLQCIARVNQQRGEVDEALHHYKEILRIQQIPASGVGNTHEDAMAIAQTLQRIANVYLQIGNTEKVVQVMSEVVRLTRNSRQPEDDVLNFTETDFHFYSIAKMHPDCAAAA